MASLTPSPKMQFFDANGNPLSGGKLYTYAAGTTTPQATYTDSTGGTTNANPVIMNSRGEASVWLGSSLYYMELKDSTDALIWTADNIGGSATITDLATHEATMAASGGSSLVGFIQAGTGAVARTAQSKMRDIVNVKDFGAVCDGVTDDTSAVGLAFNAAIAAGSTQLVFPAGICQMSAKITKSIITGRNGLALVGAGSELTVLRWSNADGGLNLTLGNDGGAIINGNKLTISGMTLSTTASAGGTAIAVDGGNQGLGEATQGITYNDVVLRGDDADGYWTIGTNITNSTKTNIHQFEYLGRHPSSAGLTFEPANMVGTGIIIHTPGDHFISDSRISFFDKAIDIQDTTEGVYIDNCAFVAGNYGVFWEVADAPTSPEALLVVRGTHINTYLRAIRAKNVFYTFISDCLTFLFDAGTPTGPYIGIECDGNSTTRQRSVAIANSTINLDDRSYAVAGVNLSSCNMIRINGLSIENNAAGLTSVNGIELESCLDAIVSSSTFQNLATCLVVNELCSQILITGNTFRTGTAGINVFATASNRAQSVTISNNDFAGMTDTTLVLDSVNGCVITGNQDIGTPTNGSFITSATHASKGNYIISDNMFSSTSPAAYDTGSTYRYGRNKGLRTEEFGSASTADGGTIAHSLFRQPTTANVQTSVSGEFASITGLNGTNITVAIKKHDNSAGTTQTIYWRASV